MDSHIESAIRNVVTSKPLLLVHPGASRFNEFYDNPSNSTTQLAESVNHRGLTRVSASSLNFGNQANFLVSSSGLIDGMALIMKYTTGSQECTCHDGWGFDAIQTIEFSFPNSLIQNLVIPGIVARDLCLLSAPDHDARVRILKQAGTVQYGAGAVVACVPIPNICQLLSTQDKPIDMSLMNGPIQVIITYSQKTKFISKNAAGALNGGTAFTSVELVMGTSFLIDSGFQIRNKLQASPEASYFQTAKYMPSYPYSGTYSTAANNVIQLNSAPSGMLTGILISMYVDAAWAAPADGDLTSKSFIGNFDFLELSFGGTILYSARSHEELLHYTYQAFAGDDLLTEIRSLEDTRPAAANAVLAGGGDANTNYNLTGNVTPYPRKQFKYYQVFLPLGKKMREIMSEKLTENLPSYNSATLTLTFKPSRYIKYNSQEYQTIANGGSPTVAPYLHDQQYDLFAAETAACTLYVTYLVEAALQFNQGSVDLMM